VRVYTASDVIAKKMCHRGGRATSRDLFHLAMVVAREPEVQASTIHLGRWGCS